MARDGGADGTGRGDIRSIHGRLAFILGNVYLPKSSDRVRDMILRGFGPVEGVVRGVVVVDDAPRSR